MCVRVCVLLLHPRSCVVWRWRQAAASRVTVLAVSVCLTVICVAAVGLCDSVTVCALRACAAGPAEL